MEHIKFRQRNKNNGSFWEWGCWLDPEEKGGWVSPKLSDNYVDPGESDLFTGKRDKNGIDIFEGDKVNGNLWSGVIVFDNYHFYIETESGSKMFLFAEPYGMVQVFEVIGNIHENKDLLRE